MYHKLHSFLHSVDTECLLCVKNYNYKDKLHTICKGYASRRLHSRSCQRLQGPHLCFLQFLRTESPGVHPESGDMPLTQISFILCHWTWSCSASQIPQDTSKKLSLYLEPTALPKGSEQVHGATLRTNTIYPLPWGWDWSWTQTLRGYQNIQ